MDQTSLMHLADSCSDIDSKAQEALDPHRRIQKPAEQLASGVLEYQNGLAVFLRELQWPEGPIGVKIFRKFVFAAESVQAVGGHALRSGEHGDRCIWVTIATLAPDPAQKNVVSCDNTCTAPLFSAALNHTVSLARLENFLSA